MNASELNDALRKELASLQAPNVQCVIAGNTFEEIQAYWVGFLSGHGSNARGALVGIRFCQTPAEFFDGFKLCVVPFLQRHFFKGV